MCYVLQFLKTGGLLDIVWLMNVFLFFFPLNPAPVRPNTPVVLSHTVVQKSESFTKNRFNSTLFSSHYLKLLCVFNTSKYFNCH